jgi:hypothetical protein
MFLALNCEDEFLSSKLSKSHIKKDIKTTPLTGAVYENIPKICLIDY